MSNQRLPHSSLLIIADRARAWSVRSQLVARRNAMVACTDLAARRRDREDVDDYFADRRHGPVDHTRTRRLSP